MPDSPITLTFTATPTFRGNKLVAALTRPAGSGSEEGGLPQLQPVTVEWVSSTTNDRSTATAAASGLPESIHAGLIEETTYYYWARVKDARSLYGDWYPSGATSGIACTAIGTSGLAFGLANGKLVPSVAGNALTIAVKTQAGNDPSAGDPVFVAFPGSSVGTGSYQIRPISAALAITVSSGSTLGIDSRSPPIAFRVWVLLFDDAGTLRLGVVTRSSIAGGVLPLLESGIASSTAEGGAGAADGNLIYTGTAVTSKPYKIIGYCEWNSGLSTLGTWDVAPDVVRLTTPGVVPGSLVQEIVHTDLAGGTNTSNIIPSDNTIPQNSEGADSGLLAAITPTSAANYLEISVVLFASVSVAGEIIAALFKDSNANATATGATTAGIADKYVAVSIAAYVYADSISQQIWNVRFGPAAASTVTRGSKFGGTLSSIIVIRELRG